MPSSCFVNSRANRGDAKTFDQENKNFEDHQRAQNI